MTVEKFLEQQVQFLRSLHSYQRQMTQRTPLVMQSITKILFQRTLITSLLELQQEMDQFHQDLQLHLQRHQHLILGVKMHRMWTLTLVVTYFTNYKVVKITLV